jgi:lipopolysaccharide/colanic/teichoic acid biosynthesis glycosyltransferase
MAETCDEAQLEVPWAERAAAAGLLVPDVAARLLLGDSAKVAGQTTILDQERVGQDGKIFTIHKRRTQDGDTGIPYNENAERARQFALDEARERDNILAGEMLLASWRPFVPDEHQEFLDTIPAWLRDLWIEIVLPTPPGLISSYVIDYHIGRYNNTQPDRFAAKARLDIRDELKRGNAHTLYLLARLGKVASQRKLMKL